MLTLLDPQPRPTSSRTQAKRRKSLARFTAPLLMVGATVACNCEDSTFAPGANYDPANVLSFGNVSVDTEKSLPISVRSAGTAGLIIDAVNLANASDESKWTIEIAPDLQTPQGLAPGRTSTITVTYRPCPMAWDGDTLDANFDLNGCPGEPDSGDLNITDNTLDGTARISLSAQPVQPPVAEVRCVPGGGICGMNPEMLSSCSSLFFGNVSSDGDPCDMVVELGNTWRNDKPVGDLNIERVEVLVRELNDPNMEILSGEEVGFEFLNIDGTPLVFDPDEPFSIPIEPGGTEGARRFFIRFTGAREGSWLGGAQTLTGLRMFTNDPNNSVVTLSVSGTGAAPGIIATPPLIDFGDVEQNSTATSTVTVLSVGSSDLQIESISIDQPEFTVTTNRGGTNNLTLMAGNDRMEVYITYAPIDTGADAAKLTFITNDPLNSPLEVDVRGGAQPQIRVSPPDTLVFALPMPAPPPPAPPRMETLGISNIGSGDLIVSRVDITGPNGDRMHASANDFSIMGCSSFPCDINLNLCPPQLPSCGQGGTSPTGSLTVIYQNDDISMTDLAELTLFSNDASDPEYKIVLQAQDEPCLFPTAVINVQTNPVCQNMPATVDATSSNPGGMPGVSTLTAFEWTWSFAFDNPALMPPDAETTSFTPTGDGVYILGLRVQNDCGAWSSVAEETILVSGNCN